MKILAGLAAALLVLTAPVAVAAADEVPVPLSPGKEATVDQPVFTWEPVSDIAAYEVEVAVDQQFVTITDRAVVLGTAYVPSRSYQAKTHYWRVRVIYADGAPDSWSQTRSFTRRWTNADEPAGEENGSHPAARVENVRAINGAVGTVSASEFGFEWDPVVGASHYEVQFSNYDWFPESTTYECFTPHTTITPYDETIGQLPAYGYLPRLPLSDCNPLRFPGFDGEVSPDQPVHVRVRAMDLALENDYPLPLDGTVNGLWSDQRREPSEAPPGPLTVDITPAPTGGGDMDLPATPVSASRSGADVPVLQWERVQDANVYKVRIALDADFTDEVGYYFTTSEFFIPLETYDDLGEGEHYFWYALPCVDVEVDCAPDRTAIKDSSYVGTFAKNSVPVQSMTKQLRDNDTTALLRWGDAITAAGADTSGGAVSYDVEFTRSTWASATSYATDNLALSTGQLPTPLTPGTYKWRVRPRDGQNIALAWAQGPDFKIEGLSTGPSPSPSGSPSPSPSASVTPGPTPTYDQGGSGDTATRVAPPTRPGKPDVSRVTKRKVLVRWRRSSERGAAITGYLVYRSTNGTTFKRVARTGARKTRVAVKRGRTYWFRVEADSSAGRSNPSKKSKFRVR